MPLSLGRTGKYQTSTQGYRAFRPKTLPPQPTLDLSEGLLGLLSSADQALGRLDGATELLPDPGFFVYSYVKKEAVLSSQIEGTQSTLIDLFDFEAGAERGSYPRDVREVVNYVDAMDFALEQVRGGKSISLQLLLQTHKRLLTGVRGGGLEPGRIRTIQNWVGPRGTSPATADYVPPPPEEVPKLLTNLLGYVAEDGSEPALIRAGLAHAQFETIHPFLDGNGRMGRLLVTLLLTTSESLRRPVLYLSYYFLKHRAKYVDLLQRTRDDGDLEGWMEFFLTGVKETSNQASETARAILALREAHRCLIEGQLKARAHSGHALLDTLFRKPVIAVKDAMNATGSTFPPANALISDLQKSGLLTEITGQKRNRLFRYQPYIDLLQRDNFPSH